ncbi:hypothetical protein [Streptomyces sp. 8L]|uniref:hypothetical protein n=1 Tax=Streptomyces sp. 8L TaxID=2877242 RepID=UPI001CD221C2|nr:hypothetical protein [Streptomyces sp. 8L]MCA1220683.1 hypothetical protein [Streptomyces sp. 8L]
MNRAFLLDLVERTVATYLEVGAGLLLADSTHLLSLGSLRVAAVAALPAALTVVKGALAGSLGTSPTASALPTKTAPAPASAVAPAPDGPAAG